MREEEVFQKLVEKGYVINDPYKFHREKGALSLESLLNQIEELEPQMKVEVNYPKMENEILDFIKVVNSVCKTDSLFKYTAKEVVSEFDECLRGINEKYIISYKVKDTEEKVQGLKSNKLSVLKQIHDLSGNASLTPQEKTVQYGKLLKLSNEIDSAYKVALEENEKVKAKYAEFTTSFDAVKFRDDFIVELNKLEAILNKLELDDVTKKDVINNAQKLREKYLMLGKDRDIASSTLDRLCERFGMEKGNALNLSDNVIEKEVSEEEKKSDEDVKDEEVIPNPKEESEIKEDVKIETTPKTNDEGRKPAKVWFREYMAERGKANAPVPAPITEVAEVNEVKLDAEFKTAMDMLLRNFATERGKVSYLKYVASTLNTENKDDKKLFDNIALYYENNGINIQKSWDALDAESNNGKDLWLTEPKDYTESYKIIDEKLKDKNDIEKAALLNEWILNSKKRNNKLSDPLMEHIYSDYAKEKNINLNLEVKKEEENKSIVPKRHKVTGIQKVENFANNLFKAGVWGTGASVLGGVGVLALAVAGISIAPWVVPAVASAGGLSVLACYQSGRISNPIQKERIAKFLDKFQIKGIIPKSEKINPEVLNAHTK